MSIADLPEGDWTPILIGEQWPSSASLQITLNSAEKRTAIVSEIEHYADVLVQIRDQNLATQEGTTAEEIRGDFDHGIATAQRVADVNRVKSKSYSAARNAASEFQSKLESLAAEGNSRIDAVNQSMQPVAEKATAILNIVSEIKGRATVHAAVCAADLSTAIRDVLAVQGIDASPKTFAEISGVSWHPATTNADELKRQIINKLAGELNDRDSNPSSPNTPTPAPAPPPHPMAVGMTSTGATNPTPDNPSQSTEVSVPNTPTPAPPTMSGSTTSKSPLTSVGSAIPTDSATTVSSNVPTPAPVISTASGTPHSPFAPTTEPVGSDPAPAKVPSMTATTAVAPGAALSAERPSAPPTPSGSAQAVAHATTTGSNLAENLNTGNHSGAPVGSGAEAIATAAAGPVHSAPPPLITPLPEAGVQAPHVFETAHASATPGVESAQIPTAATQIPTAATEATPPLAAATPTIAPTFAPSPLNAGPVTMAAPTPPSALMAYGADLRPPISTPAVSTPITPSTSPVSAPINASTGSAPTGQPAVVRQPPPTPAAHTPTAAGLTERAVAATATGAVAGLAAADAAAKGRLQRLLHAVARQQPQLAWTIGDLDDASTLLVTDVAGGWIPPNIDIPTGVTLLPPADRRSDLTALLGPAIRAATYLPGQQIPTNETPTPVATSIRSRDVPNVEDLGWELAQATKWRDGLPRLAHTLAKAVTAQSGWLDSEAILLRDHLHTVAQSVIAAYPDHIDSDQIANWQLLATIDALINSNKTLANYHFAWFRAHTLTREARR